MRKIGLIFFAILPILIYGCGSTQERMVSTLPSELVLKNNSIIKCSQGVGVLVQDKKDIAYKCYTDRLGNFMEYPATSISELRLIK